MHFRAVLVPREGLYLGGKFVFSFRIPPNYPFAPPVVRCVTKILHPQINWRTGLVHEQAGTEQNDDDEKQTPMG